MSGSFDRECWALLIKNILGSSGRVCWDLLIENIGFFHFEVCVSCHFAVSFDRQCRALLWVSIQGIGLFWALLSSFDREYWALLIGNSGLFKERGQVSFDRNFRAHLIDNVGIFCGYQSKDTSRACRSTLEKERKRHCFVGSQF